MKIKIPIASFPGSRLIRVLIAALLISGFIGSVEAAPDVASGDPALVEAAFQKDILPFITQNCFACHGLTKARGDVSLAKYKDAATMQKDPEVWDNVLDQLRKREMPPKDKPQPTQAEVDKTVEAIHGVLAALNAGSVSNVGRVTLRRLNRTEYNNTIRDLLGVDFKPAEDFPADDVGYGFDNIGDVLSVSPLLLEKYLSATESILDQAIVVYQTPKPVKSAVGTLRLPAMISAGETGGMASFDEGDYIIRARLGATQAGAGTVRAMLRIEGKDVKEFAVKAATNDPAVYETTVRVKAGTQRVTLANLNSGRAPMLYVQSVEVEGPFYTPPPNYPAVHNRLMAHTAGLETREAAREILTRFTTKAFRRPLRPGEVEKFLAMFDASQKRGEQFELGVRAALYRVLMSPDFLFRVEMDPAGVTAGASYQVSEYELASRLSYFLWNTMPDDELFALAAKGQLRPHLVEQVQRMIKDPKSGSFLQNFCEQWLTLRKLDLISPDPVMFPAFNKSLQQSMQRESNLFFEAVAREDRSVLQLLNADFTFVNEPLAKLYGIEGVKGENFIRVKAPPHRGGVLTMAGVLALNSNATRTSPVKRGKFVLEEILNTPPPAPPANVPPLEEGKQLTGTLRQIMEQHRDNPLCASCHQKMDPMGFAFENFDAIGAWREKDGSGFIIDASGEMPDGQTFEGAPGLKTFLDAKKDLFLKCLSDKMLTYAIGRGLEYYDKRSVEQIAAALAKNDYRFSALVLEIVKSDPFQMRTATGETL